MGIFGKSKREKQLESEVQQLKKEKKQLSSDNHRSKKRIKELETLCEEKDSWMDTVLSDALRHGSSEAGRQMRYKQDYLKSKK